MNSKRFKKNHNIDGWPIEDSENSIVMDKQNTIDELNQLSDENKAFKYLLQLCVHDLYSPTGKLKKKTGLKLMAMCQKGILNYPE